MIVYHKHDIAKMASMKDDESTDEESNEEESRGEEGNKEEALDSKSKGSLKIRKVIPA